MIVPGKTYRFQFSVVAAGVGTAADSTPTCVIYRNGTAEATSVTVAASATTGQYKASFVADAGWAASDQIQIVAAATIATVANYIGTVWDSNLVPEQSVVADSVWDEQYSQHTTAGTFGKLFDIWRKSNPAIDGVVTSAITPTTTTFSTNITGYPSGAFVHSVLLFVNGSTNAESNSPIIGYLSTNGVITLEEPMQQAVQVGDEFVIAANSHVHAIADIAGGVWSALTASYSAATGTFGYLLYAINTMIENVSGWRWTAKAMEQGPTESGLGQYQITLVADSTGGQVPGVSFVIVGTPTNVTTGSNGEAIVNLDAGTYTLRTTAPQGYENVADQSLVVAADATKTVTLVATAVTPSVAPLCNVVLPIVDQFGSPLAGVAVDFKFVRFDDTATPGSVVVNPPQPQTSDQNGMVEIELLRLGEYQAIYSVANGSVTKRVDISVPDAGSYVVVEPN